MDNLVSIVGEGALLSDAEMIARGGPGAGIGIVGIKKRRLEELEVKCHAGTRVGEYVPFYFCPRSVMLYLLYRGNHPELSYLGGQEPIVHLEADLLDAVAWAEQAGGRWAFSLSNAGARYTQFRKRLDQLDQIDWQAVQATDFRSPNVKEAKQAEFLVHRTFPWTLVSRIGVRSMSIRNQAKALIERSQHRPSVEILPNWYY